MNTNQPITEDLLGKYLAQETDAQESALVETWLKKDVANQKEFDDYSYILAQIAISKAENPAEQINVNVDAAWKKVKSKMQPAVMPQVVAMKPTKQIFFTPIRIAASITLLLAGILALFLSRKEPEIISLKTTQNTLEQTLPDGSVVFLNANTNLSYPAGFEGDTREINLSGEAFFKVQRNESKPFIIHANGSDIRVLGTSFNVKAYTKNVKVSVESGKVEFKHEKKQTLLIKGEEAEFEVEKDTIRKAVMLDKNTFAYKTKTFVFEDASLEHVINVLSENYHTKIILKNNNIKSCRLTTTFTNETLPNALNVIAETLNLKVTPEGEKYIIDGDGCEK
ncbi:anti-sigma factor [Emticicia aquatilis]|uniref:Anti-sigma factor n=1 Tax=Emticicia aquatilis TaxID=1537369 RepID=A0A917DZE8_9BACT|nr:FecR domain-containing protein [Emticicia aquatilis]GGD83252.1 anti-sigma factor [Emticicia aquatilis]